MGPSVFIGGHKTLDLRRRTLSSDCAPSIGEPTRFADPLTAGIRGR